jgi:hypothetical protein
MLLVMPLLTSQNWIVQQRLHAEQKHNKCLKGSTKCVQDAISGVNSCQTGAHTPEEMQQNIVASEEM